MKISIKQIIRDIKISEVLNKELNPLSKKVKDYIDSKLEGLVQFESEKYPNSIFYKKDSIILFEQDPNMRYIWCSFDHYWKPLGRETGLSYREIKELTKAMVAKRLNCKAFSIEVLNFNILKIAV